MPQKPASMLEKKGKKPDQVITQTAHVIKSGGSVSGGTLMWAL